MGQIKN